MSVMTRKEKENLILSSSSIIILLISTYIINSYALKIVNSIDPVLRNETLKKDNSENSDQKEKENKPNNKLSSPSTSSDNHYKLLNVSPSATTEDINKSYKKLAIKYHPDKNKGSKEGK